MAITLVNANLAWQEVKIALARQVGAEGIPQIQRNQWDALKAHLSQTKGNPNILFVPYTAELIVAASGLIASDVPCVLFGIFSLKRNSATASYIQVIDDAADDTGVATDLRVVLPQMLAVDSANAFFPQGLPMAAGVVLKATTTAVGSTDPTAANSADGFVIIGTTQF